MKYLLAILSISLFLGCVFFGPLPVSAIESSAADSGISENWSGYESLNGDFTGVGGRWRVSAIPANVSGSSYAVWVGLGGIRSTELLQVGTHAIVSGKTVRYSAWYEFFPGRPKVIPFAVRPGDLVEARIAFKKDGFWTVSLKNITTKKSYAVVVSYAGRFDSAEWIVEVPRRDGGALSVLPDFKSIGFSSLWTIKDGRQRSLYAAEAFPVTMVDLARKTLLAHVSATGFDGQSFTVVRDKPGEPWWVPDGYQISR